MPDSASNELALVKEFVNEGKFEEAFQHVEDLEQKENLSPEELLRTLNYKSWSYYGLGQIEIALKITQHLYQKSQELNMPLFIEKI